MNFLALDRSLNFGDTLLHAKDEKTASSASRVEHLEAFAGTDARYNLLPACHLKHQTHERSRCEVLPEFLPFKGCANEIFEGCPLTVQITIGKLHAGESL